MAGRYQKRNNSMAAVKNVGIVFVLGVVSFVIGFFLLARLLPAGTTSSSTPNPTEASVVASPPVSTVTTTPVTPTKETAPLPRETRETKPQAGSGPLLETDEPNAKPPSDEVKPIQGTRTDTPDARTPRLSEPKDEPKAGETTPRSERNATSEPKNGDSTSPSGLTSTDEPKKADETPKRRRHKKSRAVLQTPTAPDVPASTPTTRPKTTDPAETVSPDRSRAASSETNSDLTAKNGTNAETGVKRLYRVQVNVYSTEDAAKKEVDTLQDRHITAHVHKVVRAGKTLYSVQQGAYRSKEKAQAAKDKLKEQGVEAYITGH